MSRWAAGGADGADGAAKGADTAPAGRPPLSLRGRALRLLSQREHSRAELERKLQTHELREGELHEVLDALQARGFIDDERVADSLVNRRSAKLGARRVQAELQAKGLDEALVREAVAPLRETELARARAVWQKKFGRPATDLAGRARQMRFLAARGFSAEVVRQAVNATDDEACEQDD